jgi:hypothetical protein
MWLLDTYSHLIKKSENQDAACRSKNAIFDETGHNLATNKKGSTIIG